MNKTKKSKKLLAAVLAVLCAAACVVSGTAVALDARAQLSVSVAETVEETYAFGDVFTVPNCTFSKNGKEKLGTATIEYPNGTQTSKTEITLNQSGQYTLRYFAELDGRMYTKEYSFAVQGRLASYESDKTVLSYGECTELGASSVGLNVKIANGDALSFDHVFNMNEMSSSVKLLEGFIVPTVQGSVDFTRMVFTFTDVEDPSVTLTYQGNFHNDSRAYGLTYFTAAGNGQIHCGLEAAGKLHVGTTLGCVVPHSFMAMDTGLYWDALKPTPAAPDAKTFCISYDAKTNQAWAGGKIVSDLDDSNYYDSPWMGFPSGKAKLTIRALGYNGPTANLCFTSILGVDLSAETSVDSEAPVVSVDCEYETMPVATVGGSYPVPMATANDLVNGACDVNVSVWHAYGTQMQKMVDIQNGRFAVNDVGMYAIVYEARDYSGNVGRSVLWVRAELAQYQDKLTVTMEQSYPTQIELGTLQTIPTALVAGGSGKVSVSYEIFKGAKSVSIVNGQYRLEEAGEWTLICTAVDYVGNTAIDVCKLQGVSGGKPVVMDAPIIPVAYVAGATYSVPVLEACDYSTGVKVYKDCTVRVECNGTSATYKVGESFVPNMETDGTLELIYLCDATEVYRATVPVITVYGKEQIPGSDRYRNVINVEKYFYTESALRFENKVELAGVSGLKITADEAMESGVATFINPQLANEFSLDFLGVPGKADFSMLRVKLVDCDNPNVSVTATLEKGEGQTTFRVGETVLSVALDLNGSAAYNVGYKDGKFIVNATMGVAIPKADNGDAFVGFPSGKVYFSVEMVDAQQGAAIFISKISSINAANGQDNTGPYIQAAGEVVKNTFKGEVYTLQRMIAVDVLCPNVNAFVTVIAPNGDVVTSLDGVRLENADALREYEFLLTQYGEYTVMVMATEGGSWKASNQGYYEYSVSVVDGEKPTITFKGDWKTQIKVGETLIIPEYTVSDNATAADKISVVTMVINPKGMPIYLYGDTNAVVCDYAGEYRVYIYVYDEMGNVTEYVTTVTAK